MALFTDHPLYDFLVLATTLFVVVYVYFQQAFMYWKKRNFPYLEPKFPLGNSPNLVAKSLNLGIETAQFYRELKKRHLKFGGIYTMTSPILVVTDPDYVRDILQKDFHHFVDRGQYYNEKNDPLSAHLFALNESKWRNIRTKLTPTFTSGKMKMMFHSVLETSKYMTDAMEKCVLEKKEIDLREANNDDVTQFFFDVITKTVKYREDNNITRPDFLQLLINIKNETKNSENPFTMKQLVAQVFVFFIAGFDTSSATMNFSLYELCKNQELQDKVREEIYEVLEKNGGQLTYESLGELKYMQQVIDEAQRLYPPVVNLTRLCVKDYQLRDTDLIVEKGTRVVIPIYAFHRDPEYYPEPEKFDPERFNNENKHSRHPFVHLPFGEGPRNCIGLRFGIMQSKIGLVAILSKFRLRIGPRTDLPLRLEKAMLLLQSQNTLYVTAEKI